MNSRKKQRGQAMVETGLVMMIFVPMLIGIFDFAQFLYFHQAISERMRAAARYGAVHTFTDGSDIVNVAIYNDPAGSTNGATPLVPNMTATAGQNGTVTATLTDSGTDDARVRVTVTNYPYNFLLMPA